MNRSFSTVPRLVLLVASLLACAPVPSRAGDGAVLAADIPRLMRQAGIPGLSIAVIRRGRMTWSGHFGVSNVAAGTPVTGETRFSAASLSKPVFAAIVMQLVEDGKLDLDTPLVRYRPDPVTDDPRQAAITARIVLSHRTGFPDWRPRGGPLAIHFDPGTRFSYSGEGYVYLQHVVEAIERAPLREIAARRIFVPLGMRHSTFVSRPAPDTAEGYDGHGGVHDPFASEGNAAYSLQTTAEDYAVFLAALLDGRLLRPDTIRMMESPQVRLDPACTYCTDRAPGRLSDVLAWGLGWGIERIASRPHAWHWGDNTTYKAFAIMDIGRRDAVVYFTNGENGLAIAPAVVRDAMGVEPVALKWLGYPTIAPPGR